MNGGPVASKSAFRTLAQCASSLTESACDLLLERLEQVLQRRALVGLDEDLDGHARNEADSLEAHHLLRRKRDADRVISLGRLHGVLLRIACKVRRNAVEHTVDFRRGSLIAGHDPHDRFRPCGDLIDIGGSHLGFHHQLVGAPWRTRKKPVARRTHVLSRLVDSGAELILGGHIHQATISERHEFEVITGDVRGVVVSIAPGLGQPRPNRHGEARGLHVYTADERSIRIDTYIWRDDDWGLTAVRRFPRGRKPLAVEDG